MDSNFTEFEELIDPEFDSKSYSNSMLKAMNTTSNELDIDAPKKKAQYDADELKSRYESFLKSHASGLMDEFDRERKLNGSISAELKPSLEYMSISYNRLLEQVLVPYERAQKLQAALNSVHQTSTLLRDVLMFVHLSQQITSFVPLQGEDKLSAVSISKLASLHYQIQLNQSQHPNLKSLKFVKEMESQTLAPRRKSLLSHITLTISRECLNSIKLRSNENDLKSLLLSLYTLSEQEFYVTLQKIILTNATNTSRILSKSVNAIKTLPSLFEEAVKKGHDVYVIETLLQNVKVENSNLLVQFTRLSRNKASTPRQLYWGKVSSAFKIDLNTAIERGGPVGKQIVNSKTFILDTIKDVFQRMSEEEPDFEHNLQIMIGVL
ncbi:uncharacterized protein GVI51_G01155 [Nakaseomyces glabratus]|uniref:Conserved oligomeric Golgi complex subunit 5 n=1 Tax=Candida glabrata (strain ATCC 2001 / BCRC 20586 / JCM 3761 / NBRC 0622 / NRRL Y-65 / CBS 138) TaxID=284593 RepID=Q6FTM6_CANGA|nr:uncharacterized protein CAGL0G01298g [Nakaseomyces glabratus]KAH7603171.1 Golgi transport complex subunit 5 [Nakaseomyces glabratus]KAH7606694.1 Golgi transport complex subunit 5 [Nakaseomyces glabratus]QHS66051.1 uncharacterized protein GVI51_G01155 [Nakaseomyces glabratus]CAG59345.1 unnamed protein product [Nakaseomyces glabratus]|eukprot:XP_446418.1 uncharacterized protein CAGL0G01298g [[Candida] glabrata]